MITGPRKRLLNALGMNENTQHDWVRRGIVQGRRREYSWPHLLGLSLGLWLRSKSIGLPLASKVIEHISGYSEDDLDRHFAAGRKTLVIDLVSQRCFLCGDDAEFRIVRGQTAQFLAVDLEAAMSRVKEQVSRVDPAPAV